MNKEQIINNVPSADWIKCCILFLFKLPEIITDISIVLDVCSSSSSSSSSSNALEKKNSK